MNEEKSLREEIADVKKMVSPYRPNNSYGTRDLCDECYRLNDTDVEAIKQTLAKIN